MNRHARHERFYRSGRSGNASPPERPLALFLKSRDAGNVHLGGPTICIARGGRSFGIREHEHAGDALAQIRVLTDDYKCPPDAYNAYRVTFDSLQQLERDLHEHVHKENNILFPKAIRQEKLLGSQQSAVASKSGSLLARQSGQLLHS